MEGGGEGRVEVGGKGGGESRGWEMSVQVGGGGGGR